LAAETFFPWFHRTVAGSDGHRAKLDAGAALLAEIRADAEGVVHMAFLASPDEAFRPGFPELGTSPHAASAQNAVVVPERVTHLFDATAHGDVLNGAGVRGLGYQ
jgi:hypothetical protein